MLDRIEKKRFRIGLVINPLAGVGGPLAHKGSDAEFVQTHARAMATEDLPAVRRAKQFLRYLEPVSEQITFVTVPGLMGGYLFDGLDWARPQIMEACIAEQTSAHDTINSARILLQQDVDLLVFAGGDGTARDILTGVGTNQLVLGVPAGVKMHSGVFGIDPFAAAELVKSLVAGELVARGEQEVRDIDEEAFRQGVVKSRYYGTMLVPEENRYIQHVKQGGIEVDELVLEDIAGEIEERLEQLETGGVTVFGSGGTVRFIQEKLGFANTLLGIDVAVNGELICDVDEQTLFDLITSHSGSPVRLLLSPIGGQGHIVGRGNQQISPRVLRAVGRDNVWIVATRPKLKSLGNRPLILDTGDADLDRQWSGLMPIITGYRQETLYAVGYRT